jgi:hypothetical protein
MTRARRIGKWTLIAAGGALVVVVLLRVGLGIYLNTTAGKSFVARQITARIGMPVEVTQVRIGFATSTIGLTVFDASAPDPAKSVVCSVEAADADVSVFALARGDLSPKIVELRNVNLQLHVGADGEVLTTLPKVPEGGGGPLPTIKLTGGQITIRQDGRPEFAVRGVNLVVEPNGDRVKLSGTIDDPQWAKWAVSGDIDQSAKTGTVEVSTPDGPLTMDRLGSIPFVPERVWKRIQSSGRGAVALKLWTGTDREIRYSVEVRPNGASLTLPDAEVTLTQASGLIRVSGAKVELQGAKASVAGGSFTADGTIDFTPEPTVAHLKTSAEGLELTQLPESWGLPRDITGKLKGSADLTLRFFRDGHSETAGGGAGEIVGAKIRGLPVSFKVALRSDGKRYRFDMPTQMGREKSARPASDRADVVVLLPSRGVPTPQPPPCREGVTEGGASFTSESGQEATPSFTPSLQGGGWRVGSPRASGLSFAAERAALLRAYRVTFSPRTAAQPPKKPAPTTLDATIAFRDIDIDELLQKLNVKIGYRISGKVTAELKIGVPVESAGSRAAYEFTGKVSSPALTLEGLTIRDLSAHATYKNGKLTLRELKGTVPQPDNAKAPAGLFHGTATAAVEPPGEVTAALKLDLIPLGEVLKAIPNFTLDVKGTVIGSAQLSGPFDKLSDTTAWTGAAQLTAPELVVAGRTAKGARLSIGVEKGTVAIKECSATIEGIPVDASGTVELADKYRFTARLRTSGTDVADFRKLIPEVDIPAPVEGVLETDTRATGTISPFTFSASGTARATKLTLAKSTANSVELKWELSRERFLVNALKADVFGGVISGTADVPLAADKRGAFEFSFKDLDVAAATPLVPDFPVRLTGQVTGAVKGAIAPAKEGASRVGNMDVNLTAPKLTVQGIPAEQLVGKVTAKAGVLEYSLEGKTLGGSFELKGRYPSQKKDAKEPALEPVRGWGGPEAIQPVRAAGAERAQPKDRGTFRLTGADLSRASAELGFKSLAPLRGRLDVSFDFDNDLSTGSGRILLTGVRWGDRSVARDLVAIVELRNGFLEVVEVSGIVAGGTVRGRGRVFLKKTERNFFSLTITGAESAHLLAIVPEAAGKVDGRVAVEVSGQLGSEMRGSGALTMERGSLAGVAVSGLRVPFHWATAPGGSGRLAIRDASVHAGTGTATANLTMHWGSTAHVEGQVKLVNVPLRTLAPSIGEFALLGNGRVTGRFDLSGSNVQSLDDLNGTILATLGNASPREVPIIRKAVPFLNPAGLVRPFETGDVRATLSRGVFRIQRLALVSPTAQLFAEGDVTLAGRVDLNVIAHVGAIGPEAHAFRALALRVPALGPIPVGLIRDLGELLTSITVRLSITGTVSDPQVKVRVGAQVTEELARFFLSRYVPADVSGVLGVGSGLGAISGSGRK